MIAALSKTYHPNMPAVYKQEAYLFSHITKPDISSETASELQAGPWYLTSSQDWFCSAEAGRQSSV
jgi:hypothetical protein